MKDPAIMRVIHKCEETKRRIDKEKPFIILRHRCKNINCGKTLKTTEVDKGHEYCAKCINRMRSLEKCRKYAKTHKKKIMEYEQTRRRKAA
ncbi:MAG: hypothetical protein ABSH16_00045 [Sedimentisphaerales bacterium]